MKCVKTFHVLHVLHVRRGKPFDVLHILHCRIQRIQNYLSLNLQCKICKTSRRFSRLTCKTCKTCKVFYVLHVRREDIPLQQKRYPLRSPWVPVFAKKKLERSEWELFFTRPPDPHRLNVETWALECSNNFKLFFRKLRALDVHTINIGLRGGQGDGWDLRNVVDKLLFRKHRSQKIFLSNIPKSSKQEHNRQ